MEAVRAVKDLPYAAIFHEQGLGKTKIAIDLALIWLQTDIVDTVLIVTKKSLVNNWVQRNRRALPHYTARAVRKPTPEQHFPQLPSSPIRHEL